jgi:hypothetical protein
MSRPAKYSEKHVAEVQKWLASFIPKHVIYATLRSQLQIGTRTCIRIVSRARAEMLRMTGKPKEEHRSDAYEFYTQVLSDPKQATEVKIKARERLDKLLGLDAPVQVVNVNREGESIETMIGGASMEGIIALAEIEAKHEPNREVGIPSDCAGAEPGTVKDH